MDPENKTTDAVVETPKTVTVTVPVNGTDGMVDAAALAKAALAAVAKAKAEPAPVVEVPKAAKVEPKVEPKAVETPKVEATATTVAPPTPEVPVKKKPGRPKMTDAQKAAAKEAKVLADLAAAEAKAAKKAAKKVAKTASPKPTVVKLSAAEKKAAKVAAKAAKAAEKAAAKAAKIAAKAEKKAVVKAEKESNRKSWGDKSVGQCGAPIKDFDLSKMNDNEKATLLSLGTEGHRKSLTLKEMSGAAFPGMKKSKANYTVRNALRRLVRGGMVLKEDRGAYIHTEEGRKQAKKA